MHGVTKLFGCEVLHNHYAPTASHMFATGQLRGSAYLLLPSTQYCATPQQYIIVVPIAEQASHEHEQSKTHMKHRRSTRRSTRRKAGSKIKEFAVRSPYATTSA